MRKLEILSVLLGIGIMAYGVAYWVLNFDSRLEALEAKTNALVLSPSASPVDSSSETQVGVGATSVSPLVHSCVNVANKITEAIEKLGYDGVTAVALKEHYQLMGCDTILYVEESN